MATRSACSCQQQSTDRKSDEGDVGKKKRKGGWAGGDEERVGGRRARWMGARTPPTTKSNPAADIAGSRARLKAARPHHLQRLVPKTRSAREVRETCLQQLRWSTRTFVRSMDSLHQWMRFGNFQNGLCSIHRAKKICLGLQLHTAATARGLRGRHGGGSTKVCMQKLLRMHVAVAQNMARKDGASLMGAPPLLDKDSSIAAHTRVG